MNAYTIEFHVACPVNGVRVKYTLRIETPARLMLPVEQLVAEIEAIEGDPAFHEDLADRLASKFPGNQTMKAHHHGVDIETTREGEPCE